jgi:DNA gyrase/topoisomerase IV subunit B
MAADSWTIDMENTSPHPRTLRDAIRYRPGLYIGGTDLKAVHHLLADTLLAIALRYRRVWMILRDNQSVSIRMEDAKEQTRQAHKDDQLPEIIAMMSALASSNFFIDHDFDRGRILLPISNALSIDFTVEAPSDGLLWTQSFREGLPQGEALKLRDLAADETGEAFIAFRFDPSIFGGVVPEGPRLERQCKELASLNPEVEITFCDERDGAA